MRRPTLGLLVLPSVLPIPLTIRHTTRISIPLIEPNLAERRYFEDELIAQLRKMCEDAEDHASNAQEEARQKRKEALEEVMLNAAQLCHKSRLEKHSQQPVVTHAASTARREHLGDGCWGVPTLAHNKACNYKEFHAVMHENFRGTEGAVGLTRWFEKLESQFGISNVAEDVVRRDITRTSVRTMEVKAWKPNSRQPTKSSEQSEAESRNLKVNNPSSTNTPRNPEHPVRVYNLCAEDAAGKITTW
ncbi:hypothetical protein Tco_0321094 [Tanacetum coccineum]